MPYLSISNMVIIIVVISSFDYATMIFCFGKIIIFILNKIEYTTNKIFFLCPLHRGHEIVANQHIQAFGIHVQMFGNGDGPYYCIPFDGDQIMSPITCYFCVA
jgi:hypothetical protein